LAVEVIMPQMGLTMTEGTVIKWIKNEGDEIAKGEPIVEIESDKATFEVEAPGEGILLKVLVPEGVATPIATVIGYIGEKGEAVGIEKAVEPTQHEKTETVSNKTPDKIEVAQGSSNQGCEGRIFISPRARKTAKQRGLSEKDLREIIGSGPGGRLIEKDILNFKEQKAIKATPLAQMTAKEYGVDLSSVPGTDLAGKVTRQDVLDLVKPAEAAPTLSTFAPAAAIEEVLEVIPLKGIRKAIAEHMYHSTSTIPRVTHMTEVDMTEMVALRAKFNSCIEEQEKISFIDILIKVGAIALERNPKANARLDEDGIKLLANANIGIAVDTEAGLLVPNIKCANRKSLRRISRESKDLIKRAQEGKLLPDEMNGGTFTISNLGGAKHQIDGFTPIINWPEAAILGVGRMIDKPWVVNGEMVIRSIMVLSLTFDHRIMDGGPAAEFLCTIKDLLENPLQLILGA